jgi:hypothetical protein
MSHDGVWIFVDDKIDEATSFAEELQRRGDVKIEVLSPAQARAQLLQKGRHPAGVLMDVDLTAIADEPGTGPGIAQDIRTKQKAQAAKEFPIVRFSAADPLARNVFGDPSSEDLFELKILKEDVRTAAELIIAQLNGVTEVYEAMIGLSTNLDKSDDVLARIFGVEGSTLGRWSHDGLTSKVLAGASHALHVAAGAFCRLFLIPQGVLLDERLLAVRLGVDLSASAEAWEHLSKHLEVFRYEGVSAKHFARWWSRGLEEWWFNQIDKTGPLAGRTASERVEQLSISTGVHNLVPIAAPPEQPEFRPWRLCRLGLEESPPQYIPVDPSYSAKMTPQADFPVWVEPYSASPKLALRARGDQRLNKKDVEKLRKKFEV